MPTILKVREVFLDIVILFHRGEIFLKKQIPLTFIFLGSFGKWW